MVNGESAVLQREDVDAAFRAMADRTRREILDYLRQGERTAGEIARRFTQSWPAISRHLRVLRTAGLVRDRKVGRERHYALDRARLRAVFGSWVVAFDAMWEENLDRLKRQVEEPRGGDG